MLDNILEVFDQNIERVENLVGLYNAKGKGRKKLSDTDVLRAALVFLHSSLEELLRALLIWKIPEASKEIIDSYPLLGSATKKVEKFFLGALTPYRDKSVRELIADSVASYLENWISFNNLGDIKKALSDCGIATPAIEGYDFGEIPEIIRRRHNIVHKADRNEIARGHGNHRVKSISLIQLQKYIGSTKELRNFVEAELR